MTTRRPNNGVEANRRPAGQSDGSDNLSATLAADRGLRSQRRHDMVAQHLALRSAHRGLAAFVELDR